MKADVCVAWAKKQLKGVNTYVPDQLVERVGAAAHLNPEHLPKDHPEVPFRTGWEAELKAELCEMQTGFTANHVFEFEGGVCTQRHLVTTPDDKATKLTMTTNPAATAKALRRRLFGSVHTAAMSMQNLTLHRHPGKDIMTEKKREAHEKKTKSLMTKYHSIPLQHLWYYPNLVKEPAKEARVAELKRRMEQVEKDSEVPEPAKTKKARQGRPGSIAHGEGNATGSGSLMRLMQNAVDKAKVAVAAPEYGCRTRVGGQYDGKTTFANPVNGQVWIEWKDPQGRQYFQLEGSTKVVWALPPLPPSAE